VIERQQNKSYGYVQRRHIPLIHYRFLLQQGILDNSLLTGESFLATSLVKLYAWKAHK